MNNTKTYRDNAEKFWNDFENIKWFKDEPAPQYWIEFFKNSAGKSLKALDLGCGAGRNTEVLFKLGFDTYACDFYENMVSTTRKRLIDAGIDRELVEARVGIGDMLEIPYQDNFFDLVLSNGVYHNAYNMEELNTAFKETSRVLKKGGHLCFNMFSSECVDTFKNIGEKVYVTHEGLIMTLINHQELEELCEKYSLKLIDPIVEYQREVSTGMRAIMRGIFVKY
jgi:ubiquinone/menaquinone biosynthesis C-methylase UbiE